MVYDISSEASFTSMARWWEEVSRFNGSENVVKALAANKNDKADDIVVPAVSGKVSRDLGMSHPD